MGMFIAVKVVDSAFERPDDRVRVARSCPVDIFKVFEGRLEVIAENEDECTLCDRCISEAPPGAVVIRRLYTERE